MPTFAKVVIRNDQNPVTITEMDVHNYVPYFRNNGPYGFANVNYFNSDTGELNEQVILTILGIMVNVRSQNNGIQVIRNDNEAILERNFDDDFKNRIGRAREFLIDDGELRGVVGRIEINTGNATLWTVIDDSQMELRLDLSHLFERLNES